MLAGVNMKFLADTWMVSSAAPARGAKSKISRGSDSHLAHASVRSATARERGCLTSETLLTPSTPAN